MSASSNFVKNLIDAARSLGRSTDDSGLAEPYRIALQLIKDEKRLVDGLENLTAEEIADGRREELQKNCAVIYVQMETANVLAQCAKIHAIVADSDDVDLTIESISEVELAALVNAGI